jgi:hypothetical protein
MSKLEELGAVSDAIIATKTAYAKLEELKADYYAAYHPFNATAVDAAYAAYAAAFDTAAAFDAAEDAYVAAWFDAQTDAANAHNTAVEAVEAAWDAALAKKKRIEACEALFCYGMLFVGICAVVILVKTLSN